VRARRGIAENSSLTVQNAPIIATEKTSKIGTTSQEIFVTLISRTAQDAQTEFIRIVV
jgi:hypothetical protein